MLVAYELGKTESEIRELSIDEFARWVAFIKIKREHERPKR